MLTSPAAVLAYLTVAIPIDTNCLMTALVFLIAVMPCVFVVSWEAMFAVGFHAQGSVAAACCCCVCLRCQCVLLWCDSDGEVVHGLIAIANRPPEVVRLTDIHLQGHRTDLVC